MDSHDLHKGGCPYCAAAKKHYGEIGVQYKRSRCPHRARRGDKAIELSNGKRSR